MPRVKDPMMSSSVSGNWAGLEFKRNLSGNVVGRKSTTPIQRSPATVAARSRFAAAAAWWSSLPDWEYPEWMPGPPPTRGDWIAFFHGAPDARQRAIGCFLRTMRASDCAPQPYLVGGEDQRLTRLDVSPAGPTGTQWRIYSEDNGYFTNNHVADTAPCNSAQQRIHPREWHATPHPLVRYDESDFFDFTYPRNIRLRIRTFSGYSGLLYWETQLNYDTPLTLQRWAFHP